MIDSILLRLFNFWHERRRDHQGKRQALVEELAEFHSVYEAAISEFYLAREKDSDSERSSNSMAQWVALGRLDGRLQKIHLQVRSAFKQPPIVAAVSELLRRYMLTRQFLMFSEKACRTDGFVAALHWINFQARNAISLAAGSIGVDLTDSSYPFLIGFDPISPPDPNDPLASRTPPWEDIERKHAIREGRRMWEEAGHHLTPEQERAYRDDLGEP